jgi:hypothetical protein
MHIGISHVINIALIYLEGSKDSCPIVITTKGVVAVIVQLVLLRAGRPGFISTQGNIFFATAQLYRPALRSALPPIRDTFTGGKPVEDLKLKNYFPLLPRSRIVELHLSSPMSS